MPAAPLIAKKLSAGSSAKAIGMELDRRAHTYANEVDPSRTHLNLNWVGGEWKAAGDAVPEPLEDAIDRRMGELVTKRRIRKDAVKAEGFVLSSNGHLSDEKAVEFLKAGVGWMAERYGRENLLAASIHMDEDTPHAQFWIAPVIHDAETGFDRLSAKELFTPNKLSKDKKKVEREGTLAKLQSDFFDEVASGYGYDKPFTHEERLNNGRVYGSQKAYKAEKEIERAQARINSAKAEERAVQAAVDALKAEEQKARERLELVQGAERQIVEGPGEADAMRGADQALEGSRECVAECAHALWSPGGWTGEGVPGRAASRERAGKAQAGIERLRSALDSAGERLGRVVDAVREVLGRLGSFVDARDLSADTLADARAAGIEVRERLAMTLSDQAELAREYSMARENAAPRITRSRGISL